ncbi:MAG: glutathione S-transferase family protein [Proteobacteria bacterium]|nr:glutathione S-transferase family protein [Pseudomonadota bacterium]
MKLYGRNSSINVMKVLWTLAEIGLTAERIDEDGVFGTIDTPDYRALNPTARIPTLDDDGVIITQSNAIVRYLAAKHSAGNLWPTDPAERAEADRFMDWQGTEVNSDLTPVFWGLIRTKPEDRNWNAINAGVKNVARHFKILNAHFSDRPFIAGERFTMGDIPMGATCYRYLALDIDHPPLPNVRAWYDRLCQRDGFRTHVMQPLT